MLIEKTSGIYALIVNAKLYVGSAVDLNHRIRTHKSKLNLNQHPNKHLQSAYNKYQEFDIEIIEYCEKEKLLEREQVWINFFQVCNPEYGYNKRLEPNSNLGLKNPQSSEWIEKRAAKLRGRKFSEEELYRLKTINIGRKHSVETKAKVSAAGMGRIVSSERRAKIGTANSRPDLWPHKLKSFCKCRCCLDLKNLQRKEKRAKFKHEKLVNLLSGSEVCL